MSSLILGGLGFIGLNYINQNIKKKKICIDNLSYAAKIDELKNLNKYKNFVFIKGNISNKKILEKAIIKYKINNIINFAAETHVDNSISIQKFLLSEMFMILLIF